MYRVKGGEAQKLVTRPDGASLSITELDKHIDS